jgi:HSP20 family protein
MFTRFCLPGGNALSFDMGLRHFVQKSFGIIVRTGQSVLNFAPAHFSIMEDVTKKMNVKPKNKTMSILRYSNTLNDYTPTTFSNLIDRFFNESVVRTGGSQYSFVPKVDITENEKAFELHVVVPGMSKEDFKIDLNENFLTISGERKHTREKKENNFHSIESQYGTFSRTFSLPENVDASNISAAYVNGILEINLPKDGKKALKTSIKVN